MWNKDNQQPRRGIKRGRARMKVLLRNRKTRDYLHGDHRWTKHRSAARVFDSTMEAVLFAVGNHTTDLEVVLTSDNSGPDVCLPVTRHTPPFPPA